MTWLLANWRLVLGATVLAALVSALGVQSYRLLGAQGERDQLVLEKQERAKRDSLAALANERNLERTNEDYKAARARAAVARVVPAESAGGIKASAVPADPSAGSGARCLTGRQADELLAEFSRRHAAAASSLFADFAQQHAAGASALAQEFEQLGAAYRACRAYELNRVESAPGEGNSFAAVGGGLDAATSPGLR